MLKKFFCLVLASVYFLSCKKNEAELNKFSDPVITRIADFKDRRTPDSLYQFFADENPLHRTEAALAFASIQDTVSISHLAKVLISDHDPGVRKAAAFAIGQTPSRESERFLLGALVKEKDPSVLAELLEAYGRATSHWQLLKPSFLNDTLEAEALAWSVYRAGVRGSADSIANAVASDLLRPDHNERTRLGAAHFFSRSARNFEKQLGIVRQAALGDSSADVRMAAVLSLRKITNPMSLPAIRKVIADEKDVRVRVNAVRALQTFSFAETKDLLADLISDPDLPVAVTASEVIVGAVTSDLWVEVSNLTTRSNHWRVISNLYQASMKASHSDLIASEIKKLYASSSNAYEKASLITALQHHTGSFDFVEDHLLKTDTLVIKSSCASALVQMHYENEFTKADKERFLTTFQRVIDQGDAAVIGTMSGALADTALQYREIVRETSWLTEARKKMTLPQDMEAMEQVDRAIAVLRDTIFTPLKNGYNHPVDWEFVRSIPKEQPVVIKTSKGDIRVKLFVEEAPGSVANFLRLAGEKYYDKTVFHRVVPNFVIQGGCKRGDGAGSESYSIRSEFSHMKYKTGSLGMASSGKDTEGTQWFITHSPTPHLDGRYTIFGEVVEGMDVVNQIEVGDVIFSVRKVSH